MDALYLDTSNLVEHVQRSLASMERAPNADQAYSIEGHIQKQLDIIASNCERLDALVNKEPPARRRNTKFRVDQLKYDCQHLRAALGNLQHKLQSRWRMEQERDELLNRRFTTNDATAIAVADEQVVQNDWLRSTNSKLDNLMSSGHAALENIRTQGLTLKGTKRRMLDFANTLGVSSSLMRLIERRTFQDKIILFGGMVVTVVVMFILYKLLKS